MAPALREPISSFSRRKDLTAEIRAATVESLNQRLRTRLISNCRPSTRTGT
jgi:hypothetical protein